MCLILTFAHSFRIWKILKQIWVLAKNALPFIFSHKLPQISPKRDDKSPKFKQKSTCQINAISYKKVLRKREAHREFQVKMKGTWIIDRGWLCEWNRLNQCVSTRGERIIRTLCREVKKESLLVNNFRSSPRIVTKCLTVKCFSHLFSSSFSFPTSFFKKIISRFIS